ncbi:MAG TPA: deoxyribose-phosphate aldolase [Bacteroidales bacterium]|nr:MAG: deoxyribose-phosphate aldolase [Bacteroidetes bacterium GWE2_42_24]OFY26435.1 MAG: deoxyribose-phosphate aldolase [Bacteroidetes bacterium GWF2_43_11]HAQ65639.1 deoxyribose-phosphate aldolase [Bacteroidales bacterium]HBZ68166.1 deoxyribose-phosphate aldolase [Bacteroidales bacterium]
MTLFPEYHRTDAEVSQLVADLRASIVPDIKDYQLALSLIDLTTLNGNDQQATVDTLCRKALLLKQPQSGLPGVAAVCVYPPFVRRCVELLHGSGLKVASVAGAFPSGQSPLFVKLAEVQFAVEEGADEIDMVISRGTFLEGRFAEVSGEITAIRNICREAHLKVILETGELSSVSNIRKASELAIEAGAHFIKTSTGKIIPAATPEAMWVMCETIADYYRATGKMVGIKPAGGIAAAEDVHVYIAIVKHLLGTDWLTPEWFRLGASRLADNLVAVIQSINKTL